jgi:hypothetical protein
MNELDKYDHLSERLDNATTAERFEKFEKIFLGLKKENIEVVDIGHTIDVVDDSCGFKMGHAVISWEVFRVVDVIDMIVTARNKFIERSIK